MTKGCTVIPIAFLRECFDCIPSTGALTWRVRPLNHFTNEHGWITFNAQQAGKSAGTLNPIGYRQIKLTFAGIKCSTLAHRIVWALATGAWPKAEIDHINGIRSDNRITNLREATRSENSHNLSKLPTNTSGFPGVSWHKHPHNKWRASIRIRNRPIFLGQFNTPEEAYAAYLEAKRRLHPANPTPRGKP